MSHSHKRGPIALDNCNLCIEHHLFNENGQRTSPTATFPTGSLSLSPLHYYLKPTTTVLLSFPLHSVVLFHCLVCVFSHSPWTVLTSSSSNNSCPWPRVPGKGAMNGLFLSPLFFCFEFQVFFLLLELKVVWFSLVLLMGEFLFVHMLFCCGILISIMGIEQFFCFAQSFLCDANR